MLASPRLPRLPPLTDVHACVSDCAVLSGMSCRDEGVLISDRKSRSECQTASAPRRARSALSLPFYQHDCVLFPLFAVRVPLHAALWGRL